MLTAADIQQFADGLAPGVVVIVDETDAVLKMGRVTCTFPHGDLANADVEQAVRDQVRNLIIETTRAPMTEAEHNAWRRAELDRAAADLRAQAEAERTARLAAMSPDERAAHDYHQAHGEHDFVDHAAVHGDPIALLDAGVAAGLLSDDGERARLVAWRDRCVARKETP
jgi:hypothetical protein